MSEKKPTSADTAIFEIVKKSKHALDPIVLESKLQSGSITVDPFEMRSAVMRGIEKKTFEFTPDNKIRLRK
jgi:hypothetical protein